MTRTEFIEKMNNIPSGNWENGIGQNDVRDFLIIPENLKTDEEIMRIIWWAVEHEIEQTLDAALETIDPGEIGEDETGSGVVWERWCNGKISADFSDIQTAIRDYQTGYCEQLNRER